MTRRPTPPAYAVMLRDSSFGIRHSFVIRDSSFVIPRRGAMDRSNHYEAAFEAYLQWHRLCYVAVDETRRAQLGDIRVKNLDFIVYGEGGSRLLVDVKGRRFPTGSTGRERRVWECWSTQDDVDGLEKWTELFGPGYQALLVFAYQLMPEAPLPEDIDDLWTWRGRGYLLRPVLVDAYRAH